MKTVAIGLIFYIVDRAHSKDLKFIETHIIDEEKGQTVL